jgi:spore coat protein U-like protein
MICLLPASAAAQATGTSRVTMRVLPAISVTGTSDLDFGIIASTQAKTVLAKNGGRFSIQGTASTPVLIQFTQLPASLGPNLGLSSWAGLVNTSPGSGGATAFVPVAGGTRAATLTNTGRYFLWFGATLTASNAAAGVYSVPVIVTVIYN